MARQKVRSRPGGIQSGPDPVDFGVVLLARSADVTFTIARAPSDARLTASIVEDNSRGRFRILSLRSFADTTEKDSTDGTRPLKVSRGQRVEVALRFYSLSLRLLPRGKNPFDFAAVLVVQSGSGKPQWKPIRARMIAMVGSITTAVPPVVEIQQGQQLGVPVTIASVAGPDTVVTYTSQSRQGGVSMGSLNVAVARGSSVPALLQLTAAPNAQEAVHDVVVESAAFDGRLVEPLRLPVIVRPAQPGFGDPCRSSEMASPPPFDSDQSWNNWGIVDGPETILGFVPTAKLFHPTNPHEIANAVRQAEAAGETVRAYGSGWSFSEAALPQFVSIAGAVAADFRSQGLSGQLDEAALLSRSSAFAGSFGHVIDTSRLDKSLQTLLPRILAQSVLADSRVSGSLFFIEAGMTLHRLNDLLDSQTSRLALDTMGGAVGQTIAGAFSTGTHGGDFDRGSLADSVRAIYLVGAGGTHHWIEPSVGVTDRVKIQAVFPCLEGPNIHYDDNMFRAALVSMGAMGVIYAVILHVVPQYALLQVNRWSTWERLKREQMAVGFAGLFDGTWLDLPLILQDIGIENDLPNRFVQIVVNPIRRDDGEHNCYVSNRVTLPLQHRTGVIPLADYTQVFRSGDDIRRVIQRDPNFGFHEALNFSGDQFLSLFEAFFEGRPPTLIETLRRLLDFCKRNDYPWAVRAVIDEVMRQTFPGPFARGRVAEDPAMPRLAGNAPQVEPVAVIEGRRFDPQIDRSFQVMAPGGTARAFPALGANISRAGVQLLSAFGSSGHRRDRLRRCHLDGARPRGEP